jgi:predicted MPP superfamily phosphohydrolase
VGYEKIIPLVDIPGDIICIVGAFALVWLGRRFRISPYLTVPVAIAALIIFLSTQENMIPRVRRLFPPDYRNSWIPSMTSLCFFGVIFTAALIFFRDKVPAFRSDRRKFLRTSTAVLCGVPAAALTFGIITRKDFDIREVDIKIPNLPKDLQGLRLLQLSDLHTGAFFTPKDVARVVDASNNLRPDLAFITGDLITTEWDPLDQCLQQLKRLKAASGLWGCMGNHELYSNIEDEVAFRAARAGIRFLRQEAVLLKFGDHHLNLAGVDYQRHNAPYLLNTEDLITLGATNLLLSHNPDVFPAAAEKGFDLTLAGHTHGGQINFEILGKNLNIADFFTPYTKGLYTLPTSAVYVNSGLGTIGMPVRLGSPPEISLLRLCDS